MMEFLSPEGMIKYLKGTTMERAEKLCELTPLEVSEIEELSAKFAAWEKEHERMKLTMRGLILDKDRWWAKLISVHNISGHAMFHDGSVYRLIEKT